MSGIFISYRRDDAYGYAERLFETLSFWFGKTNVFFDRDAIEPGAAFSRILVDGASTCEVLIAVIGPSWLTCADERGRRLDDPGDYVRLEIASAICRYSHVIPVLVGGAKMPRTVDLPEELQPLAGLNAIEISERFFHESVGRLVKALQVRIPYRASDSEQHARDILFDSAYTLSSDFVAPESIAALDNIPALTIADAAPPPRKRIKLRKPPEVSELPPALGGDSSIGLVGPVNARLAWRADITFSDDWSFVGTAGNGWVFLSDGKSVCGVIDGTEQWAYIIPHGSRVKLTEDCRLWVPDSFSFSGGYCFNARGEGGRIAMPADPFPKSDCHESVGFECRGAVAQCFRRDGKQSLLFSLELDGNCTWHAQGIVHGAFYAATDEATVYSISPEGRVNWTYTAKTGPVHGLEVVAPGQVVFGGGAVLYRVTEGQAAWELSMGSLRDPSRWQTPWYTVCDDRGAIFAKYMDPPNAFLLGIDREGRVMWRHPVNYGSEDLMPVGLDRHGRLYAASRKTLVCFAD